MLDEVADEPDFDTAEERTAFLVKKREEERAKKREEEQQKDEAAAGGRKGKGSDAKGKDKGRAPLLRQGSAGGSSGDRPDSRASDEYETGADGQRKLKTGIHAFKDKYPAQQTVN